MKRAITIISAIAAVFLLAICAVTVAVSDREAPSINVEPMELTYSEGEDRTLLVQGITAYDYRDGDVTDSVLVKDVVVLNNGMQAKVVYVARDKANNISEGYRIVSYTKPEEPDISGTLLMAVDDLYADSMDEDMQGDEDTESISDDEDIEEADDEKDTQDKEPAPEPQTEPVKKETKKQEQKPAASTDDKSPKITLKQSSITLKRGQAIDPMSLIKSQTNAASVTVSGNANLNIPGTYNLVYTATGADGKTATANLKIVVE